MKDLPKTLWLGLPLASLALVLLAPLAGYDWWYRLIDRKEFSVLEIGTVVFLFPAVAIGVMAAVRYVRSPGLPRKSLGAAFLLMMSAGALYFGGEEISWGQHYVHWRTPKAMADLNKQKETNLHNLDRKKFPLLGNLLNNVPRQGLLFTILIGGGILPCLLHRRRAVAGADKALWYWLVPTWRLIPISLLAAMAGLPDDITRSLVRSGAFAYARDGYFSQAFIRPAGEFKEYCFGMAILFYLLSTYLRLRAREDAPALNAAASTTQSL